MKTKKIKQLKIKKHNFTKLQTLIFGILFGLVGGWLISSTFAAPQSSSNATLVFTPNPVGTGQRYTISGCGYTNNPVNIVISDGTRYGTGVWADGGCISGTLNAGAPGTYTVEAYQQGKGKKQVLMATSTITVQ